MNLRVGAKGRNVGLQKKIRENPFNPSNPCAIKTRENLLHQLDPRSIKIHYPRNKFTVTVANSESGNFLKYPKSATSPASEATFLSTSTSMTINPNFLTYGAHLLKCSRRESSMRSLSKVSILNHTISSCLSSIRAYPSGPIYSALPNPRIG